MTRIAPTAAVSFAAPLLLGAATLAAESAAFLGPAGGVGNVVGFDVAAPAAAQPVAGLTGIRLLPIDFVGHSAGDELSPRFPRQRADLPGAARLVLQQGRGSLYRYVRPGANGDGHGYFVVDALGARVLHERLVPPGAADPFLPTVAVSSDGAALLVATTSLAGGDLFEIEVATGNATLRTASQSPLEFGPHSLALGAQSGFAVHMGGVLRFARGQVGDATNVPFPLPAPTWFSREVVLSPLGAFVATTAGADPTQAFVFALGTSGAAVRVSTAGDHLSGAGFLPAADGPHLAISDDGSTLAWRTEGLKREAYVAHVHPVGGELPEHLTSDARFLDTLDEIGLYGFRPATNRLVLAIGDANPSLPNVLDSADFFAVDLPSGASPAFTNLSLSSGDASVPFTVAPTLKPDRAVWLEGADAFLVADGSSDRLLRVQATTSGSQVLLSNAKALDWAEPIAGELLLSVRSAAGNKPQELWRVDAQLAGAPALVHTFVSGNKLERAAIRPDGWLAFVESGPPSEFVWLYGGAQLSLLTSRPFHYGASLGFAPAGELIFSVGAPGAPALFAAWPVASAPKRLPIAPIQPGFVLPGA